MSVEHFIQNLFNALTVGSLYALVAIGYTMVYGILRFINFAHGDIFMVGAYLIFFAAMTLIPWPMTLVVTASGLGVLGLAFYIFQFAWRTIKRGLFFIVLLLVGAGLTALGAYFLAFGSKAFTVAWPLGLPYIILAFIILTGATILTLVALRRKLNYKVRNIVAALTCGLAALCILAGLAFDLFSPEAGLGFIMAALVAIIGATALGILVDRIAYRPLREAPRISALISAIGISFLLENLGLVIFTGIPRPAVQPDWMVNAIQFGDLRILPLSFLVPVVTLVLVGALLWIVYRTRPGLAMRAISKDIETTRLMGVSVDRTIAFTFALGSALAAAAGIMWAIRYPQINPMMGIMPGFKAFIAAVVGGIGSIQGAVLGGLLLGSLEIMIVAFWPLLSGYKDAFAFVLLIIILLVRPTGLLGEKMEEKI